MHNVVVEEIDVRGLVFEMDFNSVYADQIDPWEQSGETGVMAAYYAHSRSKLARSLAQRFNEKACGMEVGCGYGYLTSLLAKKFSMCGVDIAPLAIKRAQMLHPGIPFEVGDVRDPGFFHGTFHFIVMAQMWQYCTSGYDEIFQVIRNCLRCLEPNGLLVISQGFPKEGKHEYVFDGAQGFDGAMLLLTAIPDLRLVEAHYDDTGVRCLNDGILMLRKIDAD